MNRLVRLEHSSKALSIIFVSDVGIMNSLMTFLLNCSINISSELMVVRLEQPIKACSPTSVTDEEMEMLVRLEQFLNAQHSIFVIEEGMKMLVKLEQA